MPIFAKSVIFSRRHANAAWQRLIFIYSEFIKNLEILQNPGTFSGLYGILLKIYYL